MITQQRLKELLHYDPDSGEFRRTVSRGGNVAGSIAGYTDYRGYIKIVIDETIYLAHRLAWLYMTGEWPKETIDHENHNKQDNRWTNLRPATLNEQQYNKRKQRNNTSGYKNVYWNKRANKWRSYIKVNNKNLHLGYYNTAEEAYNVYCKAAEEYHKDFAKTS
jgi:hypothetical protein